MTDVGFVSAIWFYGGRAALSHFSLLVPLPVELPRWTPFGRPQRFYQPTGGNHECLEISNYSNVIVSKDYGGDLAANSNVRIGQEKQVVSNFLTLSINTQSRFQ